VRVRSEVRSRGPGGPGMKALVADDDPVARQWLAHVLRPHVHEVVLAEDGDQAWELLAGGLRPSVCLVDVLMPRMGGLQLLELVRGEPSTDDLPFILVSVAAERGAVDQAAAKRASAYLLKPFLAAQVRCVMAALIRKCRMARAEHTLVSLRRLGADVPELDRLLHRLEAAILSWDPKVRPATILQLREASEQLGLYRCAELLAAAAQMEGREQGRARLIAECAALVRDQREELGLVFASDDVLAPPALARKA
jgi:CheY-like chemotaxis protein